MIMNRAIIIFSIVTAIAGCDQQPTPDPEVAPTVNSITVAEPEPASPATELEAASPASTAKSNSPGQTLDEETEPAQSFEDGLRQINELQQSFAFSKALRLAKRLQVEHAGHPRLEEIRQCMAFLYEARRVQPELEQAVDWLVTYPELGEQTLIKAGEVGQMYIRHAARQPNPQVAASALQLLNRSNDKQSVAIALDVLKQHEGRSVRDAALALLTDNAEQLSAHQIVALNDLMPAMTSLQQTMAQQTIRERAQEPFDADALRTMFDSIQSDGTFARRFIALLLANELTGRMAGDVDRFNQLLNVSAADATVTSYFDRARQSTDESIRRWANRQTIGGEWFDLATIPGLTHWWRMEQAEGNRTLDSVNSYVLKLTDAQLDSSAARFGNGGASLNGQASAMIGDTSNEPFVQGAFTVYMWMRPGRVDTDFQFVAGKSRYWETNDFGIHLQKDKLSLFVDSFRPPGDFQVEAGKWYLVIAVCSTKRCRLYVNGRIVIDETVATRQIDNPWPLSIGATAQKQYPFTGAVDEFALFSRALSDSEINQLQNLSRKQ